jgi:hypothetical protein
MLQFLALSADIITVSTALNQQCTDRQLTQVLDSSIPSKLIETAVSALQAFSQAPAVTSDAVVRMWWPLDMLGRAALHLTSAERAEGRTPRRTMPEGKTGGFRTAPAVLTNNAWVHMNKHTALTPVCSQQHWLHVTNQLNACSLTHVLTNRSTVYLPTNTY